MRAVWLFLLLTMGLILGGCGNIEWFPDPPVDGVTAFSFSPDVVFGVTAGSTQTSSPATITVTGAPAISVTGGSYSIDGGTFTTAAGTVSAGTHQIRLQHTAADGTAATTVVTTVTIGGKSASFTSTTANVLAATVEATGAADSIVTGQLALRLAPGAYEIAITEGFALYSLNGADGDYDVATQTLDFTDRQVIHFQDIAGPASGDVSKSVITIDGVEIVFNARTQ